MACVGCDSSKQVAQSSINQVEEGEYGRMAVTYNIFGPDSIPEICHEGGDDVKSEERYGGGLTSAVKSEESDIDRKTYELLSKSFSRPACLFGDTDIESCDGEDNDDESEDDNDVVALCHDSTWLDTFEEAWAELEPYWKDKAEQVKKDREKELEMLKALPITEQHSYLLRKRECIEYKVYVDACFKRNRKPRFAFLVKDPSETYQFGFVGESKSRRVPQLQTHLEGMLTGVEFAKAHIDKTSLQGEVQIHVYSNNPYPVDFVQSPNRSPYKNEHFTVDVRDMLKKLVVYTHTCNLYFSTITYFDNSAADYLARSTPTSKLGNVIQKDDFDEGLKDVIAQVEHFEARKSRLMEASNAKAVKG